MQKGFITPAVALILGTLLIGAPLVAWYTAEPDTQVAEEQSFGGFNDPFISYQLATTTLTNGNVLQTDGTNSFWVSTSSLGIVGGGGSGLTSLNSQTGSSQTFATGTATGIGLNIVSSGDVHTFTPTVLSGYAIPLTASTTEWATAYGWGNHAIAGYDQVTTAGDGLTRTVNDFDCDIASGSVFGCLSSADWTTFNNKETTLTFSDGLTRTTNNIAPTAGYVIPLSASTTNWNTFYDTPSNRITAGTNLTWSGNTLNVDDPFTVTDLTATNATTTRFYVGGESTFNATSTWAAGIHPIMHGIYAADSSGLHLHSNNGTEVAYFGAGGGANITFPNYTSALLQTGASGALAEYGGTTCTNRFVRSLSALASSTCDAVVLTADVTGILPIANGGTGTSTAPTTGQVLLGNASGSYNLVSTSSLGITASAGGSNTQLQYNSGGALAGLSTLTTDGASLTMTGTSTLATTTITNLNAGGSSLVVTPGTATFGGDVFGAGMCDGTGANCFTLNSGFINFGIGAGDYIQFNGSENDADTYFSTDNATYTLFVDGGTDRVGIGTSTPAQLLTVAGTLGVTGTSTLSGKVMIGTTTPFANRIFTVDGDGYFSGETTLGSNLFVTANLGMVTDGSYISWGDESTLIGGNSSTDVLSFYTAGTENLTIDSNGNLGVGTTTPGYPLTVAGDISANNEIHLFGSDTAIYGSESMTLYSDQAQSNYIITNNNFEISGGGGAGVKNGNLTFSNFGSTAASGNPGIVNISPTINQSGTAGYVGFNLSITETATGSGAKIPFRIMKDNTNLMLVDNAGNFTLATSSALSFGTSAILSDSAGTLTLSNVDAIDATTETTLEAAIDALSNLTTVGTIVSGTWNSTIADDLIVEPDLSADVAATDGDFLQYDSTGTNFTWRDATEIVSDIEAAIESALDTLTSLTNVAISTVLQIPNGTAPTANDPGEIAHDTSDNQLILDDYVVGKATDTIFKVTVASTSPAFTNSGLLKVPTELDGFTITAIRCSVETGTSKVVAIEDASGNSSEDITCGTTVTSDDGSITNASYTAGEELYIDFGATSGSVDYVSISVFGQWVRE